MTVLIAAKCCSTLGSTNLVWVYKSKSFLIHIQHFRRCIHCLLLPTNIFYFFIWVFTSYCMLLSIFLAQTSYCKYVTDEHVQRFYLFLPPFVKRPLVWPNRKCRHTSAQEGGGGRSILGLRSEEGVPASTAQLCCYGRCCRPPVPCHHVRRGTGRADDIKHEPPRCPIKPEPFEHRDKNNKTGAAFERSGKRRVEVAGRQAPVRRRRLCERPSEPPTAEDARLWMRHRDGLSRCFD